MRKQIIVLTLALLTFVSGKSLRDSLEIREPVGVELVNMPEDSMVAYIKKMYREVNRSLSNATIISYFNDKDEYKLKGYILDKRVVRVEKLKIVNGIRESSEYYFYNGHLIFSYQAKDLYSGNQYYIYNGRLIRWIASDNSRVDDSKYLAKLKILKDNSALYLDMLLDSGVVVEE